MNPQSSTVALVQESKEGALPSVSWEDVKSTVDARLRVLKLAQKVAGAENTAHALRDQVRLIGATRSPAEQERLKEGFADILTSLGMKLTSVNDDTITRKAVPAPTKDHETRGFADHRSTPEFSAPASASEATTLVEDEELSLADIKTRIADIKDKVVGFQRMVEALKGNTSEDKEYTDAVRALGALGNPDNVSFSTLRAAYNRLEVAARQLVQADNKASQTIPQAQNSAVAPNPPAEVPSWRNVHTVAEDTTMPSQPAPAVQETTTVSPAIVVEPAVPISEELVPPPVPMEEVALPVDTVEAPTQTADEDMTTILMAPEVTAGLEELLSEWGPFEKSGIFGLGAHGIEHPLYKRLTTLSVAEVIAGRWEGGDRAITNDIRRYIDGWRQQWGVEAVPEEPFETYLRRVIAEILRAEQNSVPEQVAT